MGKVNWLSPRIILPEDHGALGFGVALGFWVFLHPWFWVALAAFEAVVAVKETAWDPRNEENQPFFWEGAKDLGAYQVGIALCLVLLYLAHLL